MEIGFFIILVPLFIYLIAALTVKKDVINHPDDYFAAFKKVGRTEFTSSSIAYGFQVSTIYPFLFWGASLFLFVPFVNAIFWGIGILLFYFSYPKISQFLGKGKTLPGIMGEYYGNNTRTIAALLTIVGFIGFIVAELWFGSRVLLAIFPNNDWIYFSAIIFVIFIAIYLFKAGQVSSIRTDQMQLAFTYFGVFGIIIYILYLLFSRGVFIEGSLFWGIILITLFIPVILLIRKAKFISFNSKSDRILNALISISFLAIFVLSVLTIFQNDKSFSLENFFNLEGFGYAGLISLMLLPLSWQFVDLTNWQRILAVKNKNENSELNRDTKKGLLNFSIESPFTWILFIVFGLMITSAFPGWSFEDILIDFPKQLISSTIGLERILGYTFIVSIISIMLSTIDSFIMGISFTYTYDLNKYSRNILDNDKEISSQATGKILQKGKIFGFISVLFAIILFIFFDKNIQGGGDLFINLMLTFYTAVLSFLPLVLGIIFLRSKPSNNLAMVSMSAGSILGIVLGVYSVLVNQDFVWFPIIICILTSTTIFLIGYFNNKKT